MSLMPDGEQLQIWPVEGDRLDDASLPAEPGNGLASEGAQDRAGAVTTFINIISDSIGDSAATMAQAAVSQFAQGRFAFNRLPNVSSLAQMKPFIDQQLELTDGPIVLFHTIANEHLRAQLEHYLQDKPVVAVDMIGSVINAIARVSGLSPRGEAGLIRETDAAYYGRIEAIEFAVEHDDGRNPETIDDADIVLIGVSRSSKTPLAIYLATLGYKVANVPLVSGSEPPEVIYNLDKRRVFGLTTDPVLLASIRQRRLGNAIDVASSYASIDAVMEDLDRARIVMRRIGCIIIRTDNRAIEEVTQEILRYYHNSFPK